MLGAMATRQARREVGNGPTMWRLPPGQLDATDTARRLGYTERRLLRAVKDSRWDEAPRPAGSYGRDPWWYDSDVEAWLRDRDPKLRREDVARQVARTAPYFRELVRRERFDLIPRPSGKDDEGPYWYAGDVDDWLAARSDEESSSGGAT